MERNNILGATTYVLKSRFIPWIGRWSESDHFATSNWVGAYVSAMEFIPWIALLWNEMERNLAMPATSSFCRQLVRGSSH
jgi:hypothetical protein